MSYNQNKSQLLWIPYILLLIITSLTTGESLARTLFGTDWGPRIACYCISFILLAILYSFGLREIKKVIKKGHTSNIAMYLGVFTLLWVIASVYTNTHSIYILLNKDEIRRHELSDIYSKLESLQANSSTQLKNLEQSYRDEVDGLNRALSTQIQDPNNGGLGAKSKAIIADIEKLLGQGSITILKGGNNAVLAQNMVKQVNDRLNEKMAIMQSPRINIERLFNEDVEYQPLFKELNETINYYDDKPEDSIRNLLRRSYAKYHNYYTQIKPIFDTPFLGKNGRLTLDALEQDIGSVPQQVESIALERIPNLLWYVKKHETLSTFLWSLALSLVIDIVSFWVYYAGILKAEDSRLPF